MPPKTSSQYADSVRKKYIEVQNDPADEKKQNRLKSAVSTWEKSLQKTVIRASNEKYPWEEEDLKMNVRKMPTKSDSGEYQTADYIGYYESPGCSGYIGILVERKGGDKKRGGPQDLYGTLMVKKNCDRFYREIERFREDKRFSQLVVIAECSFEQFLLYAPPFIGSTRNTEHYGASVEARRGKIASLYARGVTVIFAGTRHNAIEVYRALMRQWIIKNYETILKLNTVPYNGRVAIENKIAMCEAELLSLKASLSRIENPPEEVEA